MHLSITLTLISLVNLALAAPTAPARKVATSDSHQVSWGLFANSGDFTGIPVVLGSASTDNAGSLYLSNSTFPTDEQTRLRFQLKKNWESGIIEAKVMDLADENADVIMFQEAKTKRLAYGPKSPSGMVDGKEGSWGYEKINGNWIFMLEKDIKAKAVWMEDVGAYQVFFGSDIPAGVEGETVALEGSFL